jgi:beta-ribofuranosylaminobenzene 5'-phosphate synthase
VNVRIKTPARLHLGLLDMNGGLGRLYGSIGVAIERPNIVLEADLQNAGEVNELIVGGLEQERVTTYAKHFLERYSLPGKVHLNLRSNIPAHVGLGSGTQLALAVGTALAQLRGLKLSATELSLMMKRGVHSGIGIATFQHGGFVVDGGHPMVTNYQTIPPVLFRHSVSKDWFFVVAIPKASPGFSGDREQLAFQTLPPAPPELVEKICRLLVMKMLPALVENDIAQFGQALTQVQQLVGDSFAAVQGGQYANTLSGQIIAHMLKQGAQGAGQSSWGPTVYALAQGERQTQLLESAARKFLEAHGGGDVFHTRADNRGAELDSINRSKLHSDDFSRSGQTDD